MYVGAKEMAQRVRVFGIDAQGPEFRFQHPCRRSLALQWCGDMRLTRARWLASLVPISVKGLILRSKIDSGEGQEMSSGLYLHGNTHLQSYMYNTHQT